MTEIVDSGILDAVYKFGVVPLLLVAVVMLWRKTEKHEGSISKLNEDQKQDIKNHAEEVKGIQQNTLNTLNTLTNSINRKS